MEALLIFWVEKSLRNLVGRRRDVQVQVTLDIHLIFEDELIRNSRIPIYGTVQWSCNLLFHIFNIKQLTTRLFFRY